MISKCDKCKKLTDELIDVSVVNRNQEVNQENKGGYHKNYNDYFTATFLSTPNTKYPTIKMELCEDCVRVLLHWLGHPENEFVRSQIG